jgi:hypothetical protein
MNDDNAMIVPSPSPLTPMAMIDRALASGATADTLEKLMALQERFQASQAKAAFDEAMAAAKSEIPTIIKNKTTSFESKRSDTTTSYRYETLPALAAAVDPVLHRHGLNYRFSSKVDGGAIHVTCIVSHVQGHREETTLQCAPDATGNKNSVQAIGSATTYLQRYTLKLALGVSASDDTDGHVPDPSMSMEITADQFQELKALLEESGETEQRMLAYVKAEQTETMTLAQYAKAKVAMNHKIAMKKKAV